MNYFKIKFIVLPMLFLLVVLDCIVFSSCASVQFVFTLGFVEFFGSCLVLFCYVFPLQVFLQKWSSSAVTPINYLTVFLSGSC